MKFDLTKEAVFIASQEEYFNLIRQLEKDFPNIEDVEYFFGVQFGTDEQVEEAVTDLNNIIIKERLRFPEQYPCLFMVFCVEGARYDGTLVHRNREYPVFVYKSDFV